MSDPVPGRTAGASGPSSPPTAYACTEIALLRAAVRPPRAVPGASPTDLDLLRAAAHDPLLYEAVAVASASLARVLDRIVAQEPVPAKQVRRAARAVARYQLRMTGRATPFGLMAGVAPAGFGPAAEVRWGYQHTKSVRPDTEWLSGLAAALESDPEVLAGLLVSANDLRRVRGDRVVLAYAPLLGGEAGALPQEVSVRYTAAVRSALELAELPLTHRELHRRLSAAHPGADAGAVDRLIGGLVRTQLLLTDLRPPLEAADPLGHLIDRLPDREHGPVGKELRALRRELAEYAAAPLGAGRPAWRSATARMRRLHPTDRLLQVDLALDADVELPVAVREEVEQAAQALWSVAAGRPGPAHLREYHLDFLERYGAQRAVPVLELLDPDTGLGPPAGYLVPTGTRRLRAGSDPADERDQLLLALAQQAAMTGAEEIELDDELLARLSGAGTPPPSLDLLAQLHADSPQALRRGEFELIVVGTGPTAGALAGRFGHLLGTAGERYGRLLRELPTDNPQAVRAQLSFRTPRPKAANVARVPRWLEHGITLGAHADRGAPGALGLSDLVVVADLERLAVRSLRLGREVVVTLPSMIATDLHAPNAARLLEEISRSGRPTWPRWRWGPAQSLPFLPRVRRGRSVLAPARWQCAEPGLRDASADFEQWRTLLARWREQWRVPREVQVVSGDHRITLDLEHRHHLELLRNEWSQQPDSFLQEVPRGGTGWLAPDGRSNEIAFSLLRREPGTWRAPAVAAPRPHTVHPPGSDWLFAKLYCSPERQEDVLAQHLPGLLARLPSEVSRWFFIRYVDPDPHLRLRFHGDPAALNSRLLPALSGWADELARSGLSGRLVLDSYEPEVERYGGPAAMAAAERAFEADSLACLAQLDLLRGGGLRLDRTVLAAANYVDLAHRFGEPEHFLRHYASTGRIRTASAVREEARLVIDPDGHWHHLRTLPGGPELLAVWERRAAAVEQYRARLGSVPDGLDTALGSLLHMHHNRLLGIDSTAEDRSLSVARKTVHAHHERRKALA
ncbi:lantibiotic dehydratase [Kitasatospora sp. NPDC092948]|uniref:lantibiotic dehydratase n=1 Tax=Kitasatospora sp. NPDC092948 TaxID=3364088 RepID=UPI00380EE042